MEILVSAIRDPRSADNGEASGPSSPLFSVRRAPRTALLGLVLLPLVVPASRPAPAPPPLFFEDFSGPALDRSRWNVVVTGRTVNNEQQAYVDSPDVITFLPGD